MINEASIIPYTQNWKQTKLTKQNNHYYNDFKSEFELSLYYHLDMILQDGGNIEEELDKMIKKFPNQNINKAEILSNFIKPIFEKK
jgi:hypothetical protein